MIDIFRYSAISEAGSTILNPLSFEKLLLVGEMARIEDGQRQLDLACGKGEMLCQYAARHGVSGVGIDVHQPFVDCATRRAAELGVEDRVEFVVGDAASPDQPGSFDVVSCIGATWIGGGLSGTIELMARSLTSEGRLLIGEVFLEDEPPADARERHRGTLEDITDLAGILDRVEAAGFDLAEMVIASRDDWDRYQAHQWAATTTWLRANPTHADAAEIRAWNDRYRRAYLTDERAWLGWGVFMLARR